MRRRGGTTQSINGRGFAIFLFVQMLKRPWRVDETPYPKKRTRLPVILSRDEVVRLIESGPSPLHRHPDHPSRPPEYRAWDTRSGQIGAEEALLENSVLRRDSLLRAE
jgi:hypothetical protein